MKAINRRHALTAIFLFILFLNYSLRYHNKAFRNGASTMSFFIHYPGNYAVIFIMYIQTDLSKRSNQTRPAGVFTNPGTQLSS